MKRNLASDIYEDFHSGEVFQKHELFGKHPDAVPILLYQDGFEIVNPLGSAKNKHKILAVYATFGNLLPQNRSKIEPMQLVLLCREKDFKYFGMDMVFQRLVSDLQDIEENGLKIGGKQNVPASVLFILGDNLGSHCIGGFCENFSSHPYMCRFCLITQAEFQETLSMMQNLEQLTIMRQPSPTLKTMKGHSRELRRLLSSIA